MSRLIVHIGTGTILDLDDECVFVDLPSSLDDADDAEIVEYAEEHGRPVNTSVNDDVTYGNIVCYSPSSLREEAGELIDNVTDPDTRNALSFVMNGATDDELNALAQYILNGETVWTAFHEDIIDGARQSHHWRKDSK